MEINNSSNILNQSNMEKKGGATDVYLYKAKKYHYKCQAVIKKLMEKGNKCPVGYEHYLNPYDPLMK